MSVIVLRYSLYNLKNLEPGRYGPLCMASGRIFAQTRRSESVP
jgi:hypothetical protein